MKEGLDKLATFACRLADAARGETLIDASGLDVRSKAPAGAYDPVTSADVNAETAMRSLILQTYPGHGVAGEELGDQDGSEARYRWSLDPIDGTRSFICGLPHWVTLIALLDANTPILGVIDAPRLGERYIGHEGRAVLVTPQGEKPLQASGCFRVEDARFSTTDPFLFERGEFDAVDRLRRAARMTRYGLDGYAYARLAAGSIDLVVESGLRAHDLNALIPVIKAAGGTIGDWSGSHDFSRGRVVAAATEELYREAVSILS